MTAKLDDIYFFRKKKLDDMKFFSKKHAFYLKKNKFSQSRHEKYLYEKLDMHNAFFHPVKKIKINVI